MERNGWANGTCTFKTIDLELPETGQIFALKSHDTTLFCGTSGSDGGIGIFQLDTGKKLGWLQDEQPVNCFSFIEGGKKVVSGGDSLNTKIWDVETQTVIASMEGHQKPISCLFANDRAAITGSSDDCLNLWDMKKHKSMKTLYPSGPIISIIALQNSLITSLAHGVKVWDINKSQVLKEFSVTGCLRSMEVSEDKTKLIVGSTDKNGFGVISIFLTSTWESVQVIRSHAEGGKPFEGVFNAVMTNDNLVVGALNATTRDVGRVYVWDAATLKFKYGLKDPHGSFSKCFSVTPTQIIGLPAVKGGVPQQARKYVTYTF